MPLHTDACKVGEEGRGGVRDVEWGWATAESDCRADGKFGWIQMRLRALSSHADAI